MRSQKSGLQPVKPNWKVGICGGATCRRCAGLYLTHFGLGFGAKTEAFTVPKMYPRFGNGAFFAFLATLRINKLRAVNNAK
jgi:hypothetical protein